jgi:hypothetical protein
MRRWLLAPLLALIAAGCADNPYGIVHDPPPDSWPGVTYNSTPPTLTNLQGVNLQADVNGNLKVNVASGGGSGGTSSSFGSAFPATGTAAGAKSSGGNMAALNLDSSGNLYIDCSVGCAGGSSSNASSGVATSSTNGQTIAWGYAFNGTTWDQIQDDASKNLKVAIENTPTVTANAGTNLNTSLLALESGGNLAAIAGAVTSSVMQANLKQVNGVTTLTGAGASGTGAQRVTAAQDTTTIAGSAPGTAGSPSTNVVSVQGVGSGTTLPVTASQATASNLNATVVGTGTFAVQASQATASSLNATVVGAGSAGSANAGVMTIQGIASMTPVQATLVPATSGGLSIVSNIVANNTTSVAVKASAGQLYGVQAFNNGTTIVYIKLYNATQGSTTCGSGTPVARYMIPAPSSGGSGFVFEMPNGMAFSTAITYCVTGGIADNDTTAPAASTFLVNFVYD